jgi:MFS family permease
MQISDEKHSEYIVQKDVSDVSSYNGYPKGIRLVLIMVSLMLGTTLMALDATIISVVTPKITTQFQALGDIGWYGAAYSMSLTAFTPIASNFYKYFNPKYVYLAFIVVFEGKSVITVFSP